jgi:signal transduction histidine kinase
MTDDTQKTVLIVEDEELLAEAISATVSLEGLETVVTSNGKEALSLARRLHPDLVLLDVMLPGMTGIEVCATLKTDPQTKKIPVILVTARAEKEDRALGMAAGADAYVTKPFSPVRLIDLVNETLSDEAVETRRRRPSLDTMSPDQLTVYARDLKVLWQQERQQRKALEKAQERLAELDRLKADFLGTVTHELLTPFASLGTILELLQEKSEGCSPDFRESLDDLVSGIAGLHQRIRGVVKFAELATKRRDPHLGYHSMDHVIPWAAQPVAVIARHRDVDFRVLVPSDLPKAHIDAELVGEAVFQMAHNAVKFNHEGGRATVRALESGGAIVIEVSDTGIGLTPERLAILGRSFEQGVDALQRGQEGLGIGWTFVRYVAKVHGGWTEAESPGEGQGSTFSLALPIESDA